MNQHQEEIRHNAAKAFIESLSQLRATLQTPGNEPIQPATSEPLVSHSTSTSAFDMDSFEQAVADIEEFIEKRQINQGETE